MAEYRRALSMLVRPVSFVLLVADEMDAWRVVCAAAGAGRVRSSDVAREGRMVVAIVRGVGDVGPAAAVVDDDGGCDWVEAKKEDDVAGIGATRSGEVFVEE